jgi:membrane protein required for colicin V production
VNTSTLAAIGWIDWLLLAALLLSIGLGVWRGLVFELLSLLGWVVAYVAAQQLAPQLAPQLPIGDVDAGVRQAAAFALVFVGALIVWLLTAQIVRLLIEATPLTLIDRTLGAGFGLLRGLLVLLVAVTVVALTPARTAEPWAASLGVQWLTALLQGLKPVLPHELVQHLAV